MKPQDRDIIVKAIVASTLIGSLFISVTVGIMALVFVDLSYLVVPTSAYVQACVGIALWFVALYLLSMWAAKRFNRKLMSES